MHKKRLNVSNLFYSFFQSCFHGAKCKKYTIFPQKLYFRVFRTYRIGVYIHNFSTNLISSLVQKPFQCQRIEKIQVFVQKCYLFYETKTSKIFKEIRKTRTVLYSLFQYLQKFHKWKISIRGGFRGLHNPISFRRQ